MAEARYRVLEKTAEVQDGQKTKLEYLAVYGHTSMGVPVGELQYGTVLDGHMRPRRTVIGRRLGL